MGPGAASQLVAVGVDGGEATTEAARYAAEVAAERGWDLMVVHSYADGSSGSPGAPADDAARRAAEALVDEVMSSVELGTRTRVHRVITPASAVDTLRQISGYVSLLVLGQHRFDATDQVPTGQVGPAVTAGARCPVVVVPAGWTRAGTADRPVVVAIDGETPAEAALRYAFEEAELRGTEVLALRAVLEQSEDSVLLQEPSFGAVLAALEQAHPRVKVRTLLVHGNPSSGIVGESVAAAQVVVGRPATGLQDGAWWRSVAGAVMIESACPVLIAPSLDPATEARARGAANAYIGRGGPRPATEVAEIKRAAELVGPGPGPGPLAGPDGPSIATHPEDDAVRPRLQPVARSRAWAGAAAPVLLVLTVLVGGALRQGYDPFSQLTSELARGPHGWLQKISFLLSGGLVLLFASAVARAFRGGPGARSAPVTFGVLGICLALCSAPTPGAVQGLVGTLVVVSLPTTCFLLAWRLRWAGSVAPLGRASMVVGGALVLLAVLLAVSRLPATPLSAWSGLLERTLAVLYGSWLLGLAVLLLSRRRGTDPSTLAGLAQPDGIERVASG